MLQLLNLKTILIVMGVLSGVVSAAYLKGCSDGDEKGYARGVEEKQSEVDKWRGMYQNLRDQPPKVETRTVTKYVITPARVETVGVVIDTPEEVTSYPYHVAGPGTVQATYIPLASLSQRFRFDYRPEPMKVDTVYVTETKTALEYVEVSIFEQAEFYVVTILAAVGGFAAGGGF